MDPEQELKLIEDMQKENLNENLEDKFLSQSRRKADLDFLDEISKVSTLSKKSKIATMKGKIPFLKSNLPSINFINDNIDDKVNAASDTYDIKNNVKHAEATDTMKESGINSFREQGETSKFVKKYEIIEELKFENVFGMFFRDRNLWKNMSKKTRSDFSNKLCDLFIKFDNLDYRKLSIKKVLQSENNDRYDTAEDNEENQLLLYLNENKKYFYFLNLRIKLLFFLNNLGCDHHTLSYRLQEKLNQLKDDILMMQCDINYLRKFGLKNEKINILSSSYFLVSNNTFDDVSKILSKMNF